MEVKVGRQYECKDGVKRWLVMLHKPGSGHSVTWDTVDPRQRDYWSTNLFGRKACGHAGNMARRKFERLAVADCTPEVTPNVLAQRTAGSEAGRRSAGAGC